MPPTTIAGNASAGEALAPAMSLADLVESVVLRDGAELTIRPLGLDDLRRETEFICGLSPQSGYQRLLSGRRLSGDEIRRLVQPDYPRERALAAIDGKASTARIVGVARYAGTQVGADREIAIVIADAWQGRGLGEALLVRLIRAAERARVEGLTAITASTNMAMLGLARKLGFHVRRDPDDAAIMLLRLDYETRRATRPIRADRPRCPVPSAISTS